LLEAGCWHDDRERLARINCAPSIMVLV